MFLKASYEEYKPDDEVFRKEYNDTKIKSKSSSEILCDFAIPENTVPSVSGEQVQIEYLEFLLDFRNSIFDIRFSTPLPSYIYFGMTFCRYYLDVECDVPFAKDLNLKPKIKILASSEDMFKDLDTNRGGRGYKRLRKGY